MQNNPSRFVTGLVLITIASTFLLYQLSQLGSRFLNISDHLLISSVDLNQDEQILKVKKTKLDQFNQDLNKTNNLLEKAMQESLQWNDSVQYLMEASLDNMERIQQIYEQKILPGEDKIDSLSAVFDTKSDKLLSDMEQYNKDEIALQKSKILLSGTKDKQVFTIVLFLLTFILFLGFLFTGFIILRR
jgi:uncharacterized membrane protein